MDTENTPDSDFDAAFASAIADDGGAAPAEAEPAATESATSDDATSSATSAPVEGASFEAAPGETPPAEPAAAEPAAAEPEAKPANQWAEPVVEPDATPGEPAVAEPEFQLSAEDQAALQSYQEDFPEIYRAETIRQTAAMQQALGAFSKQLGEFLAPILAQVGQQATQSHEQAIAAAHPDFQTISPALVAWVGEQPPFMRDTFNKVLSEGTTQQVVDLLTHYKRSVGQAAPAAVASATAPAVNPATQQAAAALAPVQSGRGAPSSKKADPDDFDGAFAEALSALG